MKNILSSLLSIFIIFNTVCYAQISDNRIGIYVQNGATEGDGTINSPFGKFEEARDYIRGLKEQNKYPINGVTVYFREGKYFLGNSLELSQQDSGTPQGPVTYRAFGNEDVQLIGGVSVSSDKAESVTDSAVLKSLDSSVAGNIKQINVKKLGINNFGEMPLVGHSVAYYQMLNMDIVTAAAPEVFFDNDVMVNARWPNDDYTRVGAVIDEGSLIHRWTDDCIGRDIYVPPEERPNPPLNFSFKVSDDVKTHLEKWANAPDARMHGYWSFDWSDLAVGIDKVDVNEGILTSDNPSPFGVKTGQRYFVFNVLEELDVPGEWYLDRNNGVLYFYPPRSNGEILISTLEAPILNINGAQNINIKSLTLKASRTDAINIKNCNNVNIELCSISKTAEKAVVVSNSSNCGITSCHIYDTGSGGITLGAGRFGEKSDSVVDKELIPCGNFAENNMINNYARRVKNYSSAVLMRNVGTRVSNNKIFDAPHMAIKMDGYDGIIEYNEIFDVLKEADDSSTIYTGRSKINRGNVIRNNYFHDLKAYGSKGSIGVAAVYFDDLYDGATTQSNIFENIAGTGVFLNGGRDHTVTDNIFINTDIGLRLTAVGTNPYYKYTEEILVNGFSGLKDGIHKTKAYEKYTHLSNLLEDEPFQPKYNVYKNNVVINTPNDYVLRETYGNTEANILKNNDLNASYTANSDLGFANMEKRNYILKEDAQIFQKIKDFKAPDFKNMGMYTPQLKVKLKDTVSLLVNSPIAYKDFEPQYIDVSNYNVVPIIADDKTYLPIRFIADLLECKVEFENNIATVYGNDKKIEADLGSNEIKIDGKTISDEKAIVCEDRLMLPVRIVSELFGKKVSWYEGGLIIIGNESDILKSDENKLIGELQRRLSNN